MPVLKPVRPASQSTATQLVTAGAAFQYTNCDFDQPSDPTSPIHTLKEKRVVSDE